MNPAHKLKSLLKLIGICIVALQGLSFQDVYNTIPENGNTLSFDFETYDIQDGLASNVAYAILEDKRGFIWIGTQDGLNRFDGYNFRVYRVGPEGGAYISHSGINALFEDADGYIWIGTEGGGLNCFDPFTEMFWHFSHDPDDPGSLSSNHITSIAQDQDKSIWIGTSEGLNQMQIMPADDMRTSFGKPFQCKFKRYTYLKSDPNSISDNRISCLYVDKYNNLWIGTSSNGLNLLLPEEREREEVDFISFTTDEKSTIKLSHNSVNAVLEDQDGNLWVATSKGVNRLSGRDRAGIPGKSQHILIPPPHPASLGYNVIYDLIQDLEGKLWLASIGGGISVIPYKHLSEESDIQVVSFVPDDQDPNSINSESISCLALSRKGDIWFTTNNMGIGMVNTQEKKFHTFRHNPYNSNSLSHNVVKSIIEDQNENLWIGTWGGGMLFYSVVNQQFKTYAPDLGKKQWLGSDIIQVIAEDQAGVLWIGTQGMGLYRFYPDTEVFENISGSSLPGSSIISNDIWSIFPGHSGEFIWIGTYEGLDRYEISTGHVKHYLNDPEDNQSLSFNEIRALYEDHQGNLWIGTGGGGLDRLNIKEDKFYHFRFDPSDSTSLSNNSIYSIFEDRSGNIWVGTLGGGLNRIDREDKYSSNPPFYKYNKADGLANDVVKGILEDARGNLWISTSNGLSKLNTGTNLFVNYSESDGLQSNVFNLGACCKTNKGQLIFGGVNGLTIFSPEEIPEDTIAPQVLITDLKLSNKSVSAGEKVNGKTILDRSVMLTDRIDLSQRTKVISFEFAALSFTDQKKIKYAYRLEGLNEIWNETDYRGRSTTYSNLKPGKYKFQVKASNSNGIFTESNTTEISLQIHPVIFRAKAAIALYLLLIFLVSFYLRNLTIKRKKLKLELGAERTEHQRIQEMDQMKLRFFTNISHEFRTPLTLLYGPLQKLSEDMPCREMKKQVGIMEKSVNRMLRLVNQILDFRKMEYGALEFIAAQGDLARTIKDVASMFEEIAYQKNITYELSFSHAEIITWYDPDKIEKILINLLSNAFKYTAPHDKIAVEVSRGTLNTDKDLMKHIASEKQMEPAEEYICIRVKDTGTGISEKDLGLIFERFYKVENPDQPDQGGAGIGLAMVKNLVELHHGEILVKSEINKGSTFSVYIPFGNDYLSEDEMEDTTKQFPDFKSQTILESVLQDNEVPGIDPAGETSHPEGGTDRRKSPLLLIVEDDHDLLGFLKDSLSEHYRIHTAGNGVQALKSVITNHPELVISDIMMPQMDGIELTMKIKSDIRISHIPIILLTSKSALEHRLEGLESGADAYLSKPFSLENLSSQIQNLLNSRKLLKEKFIRDIQIQPEEIKLKSIDQIYLEKAIDIVETFIADDTFTVERFAGEMFESRVQLYRKLKGLTGLSPNEFVRNIRIKRAAEILVQGGITVGEVMYKVGFSNRSYFNRSFRQVFDTTPVEYQQSKRV